jgi:hypothetical protein
MHIREYLFETFDLGSYATILYRLVTYGEEIPGLLVILFIQWYVIIRCPRVHFLRGLFMDRYFAWRFWQTGRSESAFKWIGFRIVIVATLVSSFISC